MQSESSLQLKIMRGAYEASQDQDEAPLQLASSEYQDPSPSSQRPERWYNGSLMGYNKKSSELFGPKGRLRALHVKITSQETPGSQPRDQLYRLIGDVLSQFFPSALLDPLVEELVNLESIRLPQAVDEAICVVLASVDLYLRRYKRTLLKEKLIEEIASELNVDINRKKILGARWFLAKKGFWQEYLGDITTATYEILRNLTVEAITEVPSPNQEDLSDFRRRLYHQCMALIDCLAKTRRRPQGLEIYAHVIASIAAEKLLKKSVLTSRSLRDPKFDSRVYRGKRQFCKMLQMVETGHIATLNGNTGLVVIEEKH
ncbi:MAG: hypothetical protein ACFFGZ_14615 [Candidatus Thorarchaeota archaeon]